jgi:precorrin-2 dehydrogenase/sirohydrochlorin ferrochelatase
MDAFPAYVPLAGRRVIIVGEGEMAEGKAALFVGSPADLVRLPDGPEALAPATYVGAALVFIASPDEATALACAKAARAGGAMLVNVVDRPAYCDFYTPALVDRGAVVAAVGTTGSGPMLAGRLKTEIDKVMPARVGELALMLKAIQGAVRARFPEFGARKAFLATVLDGPAAAAALAGDAVEGERLALAALAAHTFSEVELGASDGEPPEAAGPKAPKTHGGTIRRWRLWLSRMGRRPSAPRRPLRGRP